MGNLIVECVDATSCGKCQIVDLVSPLHQYNIMPLEIDIPSLILVDLKGRMCARNTTRVDMS